MNRMQLIVWALVPEMAGPGETITASELCERMGLPPATHARGVMQSVAAVARRFPDWPCWRVRRKDGSYPQGPEQFRKLLKERY